MVSSCITTINRMEGINLLHPRRASEPLALDTSRTPSHEAELENALVSYHPS